MLNIVKYSEKQDLPSNPYEENKAPRPTLQEYLRTLTDKTTVYDLDNYGIKSISYIPFSPETE